MDKFFKISERASNFKTEIIAGLTTFFAMAYIVITNPNQITSFSTDGALGQIWNAVYARVDVYEWLLSHSLTENQ